MTTLAYTWIFFILLQVVSIGFAMLSIWRLYHYIKRYKFDESKYTLLFGFVHLHWIVALYLVLVMLSLPISYFIFTRL